MNKSNDIHQQLRNEPNTPLEKVPPRGHNLQRVWPVFEGQECCSPDQPEAAAHSRAQRLTVGTRLDIAPSIKRPGCPEHLRGKVRGRGSYAQGDMSRWWPLQWHWWCGWMQWLPSVQQPRCQECQPECCPEPKGCLGADGRQRCRRSQRSRYCGIAKPGAKYDRGDRLPELRNDYNALVEERRARAHDLQCMR